jgi:hypothetical protein
MDYQDVLEETFLKSITLEEASISALLITFFITAMVGIYIFGIYRLISRNAFYSQSFNVSLVALSLITAAIIVTIQSSIVISLGMVGALSIVRFRTAIKNPMDLVFLFWAIANGIICGTGLFEVIIILSIVVTIFIFLLNLLPIVKASKILIINSSSKGSYDKLINIIEKYSRSYTVKSHNISKKGMDVVIELRVKNGEKLVESIGELEEVFKVSLLSHDGEVTY